MYNQLRKPIIEIFTLFVFVTLYSPTIFSQGESAVPFLLISPNARASGMGESGGGLSDDVSAIYWNPAGLAFQDGEEISITHSNWLPQFGFSDLFYEYANYKAYVEDWGGTIASSITYLNLGEFIRTGSGGPDELGRWKAYEGAFTVGGGWKVLDELGVGVNLRYIRSALSPFGTEEEQGTGVANTVSFDIGTFYKPQDALMTFDDVRIKFSGGINLSNLGPKVTYIDEDQSDPLPTNVRLAFAFHIIPDEFNSLTYNVDFSRVLVRRNFFDADGDGKYTPDSDDRVLPTDGLPKSLITAWSDGNALQKVTTGMGLEYWYGSPRLIALRFGWFYEDPSYGNRNFLTFGAGLRYDMYGFDFSYISVVKGEFSPLAETLRFTLLMKWGGLEAINASTEQEPELQN
ncbi:MAG: PorV/PorQ family protein [Ignavibacteria bacterium]|nr:PorV/PorQ family protein [Ignavibacteria bacterium]